ncbi:MAG: UDP-N-acetylmuramate dehydrogenase [Chloroflexi bacterium]|nr:UDP-N-acetylmuramate dehydrogenase [Chloroflexota bacterium]
MALPMPPPDLNLLPDEPMAKHTYLRLGGPAAYFGIPDDAEALDRMLAWARDVDLAVRIAGGGSNVLVSDEGVRALVISLRRVCGTVVFADDGSVHAGAGVMLPALARQAAERGLSGMEFAIGIPGSVGGALQTNAGIGDGRCVAEIVRRVDVLRDGRRLTLARDEIRFEYRNSSLREAHDLVLGAEFMLSPGVREEIEAEMRRLLEARQASQPTSEPNAGSVFRNPQGDYAGRLIEGAGCKGLRIGGAQVSTLHANFITQDGTAKTADVVELMTTVQARVRAQFGIALVPEIEWWGRDADDPPPAPWL